MDTGSEHAWISEGTLGKVGFAIPRISPHCTIDEVVFAHKDDLQLLGARTLEGLNLTIGARQKKLVAAGPLPAA